MPNYLVFAAREALRTAFARSPYQNFVELHAANPKYTPSTAQRTFNEFNNWTLKTLSQTAKDLGCVVELTFKPLPLGHSMEVPDPDGAAAVRLPSWYVDYLPPTEGTAPDRAPETPAIDMNMVI